jgi:hypothetical protein
MGAFHERFLARLPLSVLRSVAQRMGIEGVDEMEREPLLAALAAAPAQRAAALGKSLRRLVGRLPGGVLRGTGVAAPTPEPPPPEKVERRGKGSAKGGDAAAGPAGAAGTESGSLEFETVSMAEVLLRQGHIEQARETLQRIVGREPGNAEARRRLEELQGGPPRSTAPSAREVPAPPGAGQTVQRAHPGRVDEPVFRPFTERPSEPVGLLDFEETPLGYGRIYAGLLMVEPTTVYAYWEVTNDAVEAVRRRLGDPDGRLTLRLVSHHAEAPSGGAMRDVEVVDFVGEYFFLHVKPGSRNRAAVGVRARNGIFEPICHSGMTATSPGMPSSDTREVWLEVEPPSEKPGLVAQPIRILSRTEGSAEEALWSRARRLGLGGLPEEAQRRLLARLHELLAVLGRPGALPTSPGMPVAPQAR